MPDKYDGIIVSIPMSIEDYKKLCIIAARSNTTPQRAAWALIKIATEDTTDDK